MSEPTVSIGVYAKVWVALLVFTALTAGLAFAPLGPFHPVVAMAISAAKGLLVAVFFMHLRYSSRLNWIFAGAGLLWLVILIGLTLGDLYSRGWVGATPHFPV